MLNLKFQNGILIQKQTEGETNEWFTNSITVGCNNLLRTRSLTENQVDGLELRESFAE